jgi:hypothetical protein
VSSDLVVEVLAEAATMGLHLRLAEGKIKASYPAGLEVRVAPVLERLRENREQVAVMLRERDCIPKMPPGVRLVRWNLKKPPVIFERWSVVNDVDLFAKTTLKQLRAALSGRSWLAGNWSVCELVARLEEVGVSVEIE